MATKVPSLDDNGEELNLDRPYSLDPDTVLPEWVHEKIEATDGYSVEDVFVSQTTNDAKFWEVLRQRKLYPLTVFCLLQLLSARTNAQYHQLDSIIDQHKQWQIGCERKAAYNTYWEIVDELVAVGLIERVKDGTKTKFGLPDGNDVAPSFQPDNPGNLLDCITMKKPVPKEESNAMLWPALRATVRPPIRSTAGWLSWLGNPWDFGLKFLTAGVALTILYVDSPLFGPADLTTYAPAIFWALLSVGIAAMVVDVLDQVRTGYQNSDNY